jgi:thymidylate synthase (FAD)
MDLPLIGRKDAVLDGITGFVEHYDFALANSSYKARVHAVTKVASICYQSPKALDSVSLFNRLQAESAGLPSSSYEFVPVLLKVSVILDGITINPYTSNCLKFGEFVESEQYLLTNLRALIEDVGPEESLNYLNTDPAEQQIIRDNFKVFLFNVDVPTRTQMIRHRVSWQELSRRYVSGKKSPFNFYISKKIKAISAYFTKNNNGIDTEMEDYVDLGIQLYDAAIANGVKPEEARRILPQAMLTTIWGAFQPSQLESYFTLRLDKHAQREIRQVSEAMQELIHA